jgi:hypothetical protein
MTPESVSFWADVAAVFLLVQMLLATVFMAVGLGMAWWYLRKGRKKLVLPFLYAQVYALRVQKGTAQIGDKIAGVPIAINSTTERVKVTTQALLSGNKTQGK